MHGMSHRHGPNINANKVPLKCPSEPFTKSKPSTCPDYTDILNWHFESQFFDQLRYQNYLKGWGYYVVITNDFDKLLALDNLLDSQTLMPLIECSLSLIICEATAFCFIFLAEGDLLFCGNNNLDGENGKTLQHHVQLPHSNRIMIFLE